MSLGALDADEYRLKVGEVTLGICVHPHMYLNLFPDYFRRPCASETADFRLNIHILPRDRDKCIPDSLFHRKRVYPKRFTLADGLIRGRNLPGASGVELRVPKRFVDGAPIRIFEHLLYQAFNSASRRKGVDCILLHSAGIVHQEGGYLFVGPSGSGKSTVSKLSAKDKVLNDEICLVSFQGRSVHLQDTPFNGFYQDKVAGDAPLNAIFLLAQSNAHQVLPISRSEAVTGIFQQIVPPVGLDEPVERQAHARMLEVADRLFERVPVLKLGFKQDDGFWREIEKVMERRGDHL